MNISFSTTDLQNAKTFLAHDKYNSLNQAQKDFVLSHLPNLRVQDPNMYNSPSIESNNRDPKLLIELVKLSPDGDVKFWNLLQLKQFSEVKALIDNGFDCQKWITSFSDELLKNKQFDLIDTLISEGKMNIGNCGYSLLNKSDDVEILKFVHQRNYDLSRAHYTMIENNYINGLAFLIKKKIIKKMDLKSALNSSIKNYTPKHKKELYLKVCELIKNIE